MLTGRGQAEQLVTARSDHRSSGLFRTKWPAIEKPKQLPVRVRFRANLEIFSDSAVNASGLRTLNGEDVLFGERNGIIDDPWNGCGRGIGPSYAGQIENLGQKGLGGA